MGTTITIEDITVTVPIKETVGIKALPVNSYYQIGGLIRSSSTVLNYNLLLENDTALKQLEELAGNPSFATVPIKGLSDKINSGLLTKFSRKWETGLSKVALSLRRGYNKFFFDIETVDDDLSDRWHYLIMEDFASDTTPWTDVAGGADQAVSSGNSTGYGKQEQDIYWEEVSGSWVTSETVTPIVNDQTLHCATNGSASFFVAGHEWWSNYTVESWVLRDNVADYGGLVFRFHDSDNYYVFRFITDAQQLTLLKTVNGVGTTLKAVTIDTATTTNTWYHLKVTVVGHRIKCYLDKELIIDYYDDSLPAGRAGCYTYNDGVYLDDFRVILDRSAGITLPADTVWSSEQQVGTVNTAFGNQRRFIGIDNDLQFTLGAGDDCLLWLKMDEGEGDIIYDHGKNKTHGVFIGRGNGVDWYDDDEKGNCIYFDGSENIYIDVPGWSPSTVNQYTIDVMIKAEVTPYQYIVNFAFKPLLYSTGPFRFYFYGSPSTYWNYNDFATNEWYRMSVIVDADNQVAYCFVNGILIGMLTGSNISSIGTSYLYIGNDGATPDKPFTGYIKNLRVYDTLRWDVALGHDQTPATVFVYDDQRRKDDSPYPDDSSCVLHLHLDEGSGTTCYDASGRGHDATMPGNDPTWTTTSFRGEAGTCLTFDAASTQYLSVTDHMDLSIFNVLNDKFSIEVWFKLAVTGVNQCLISKWLSAGDQREWYFGVTSADELWFEIADGTYTNRINITGSTTLSDNEWYHAVVTYDNTQDENGLTLYLNGSDDSGTRAEAGNYTNALSGTANVNIGRTANGDTYFTGSIDEVRIHRKELSADEVAARYRSEPSLIDWSTLRRVYSTTHCWEGEPVITNGLVTLVFPPYDKYEERDYNCHLPVVYGWHENSWYLLGTITPRGVVNSFDIYLDDIISSDIDIIELTDQSCTVKITYRFYSSSYAQEKNTFRMFLTVRNGYPGVLITTDYNTDWFYDKNTGFAYDNRYYCGTGDLTTVAFMPGDNIINSKYDSTTNFTESDVDDCWGISFTTIDETDGSSKNVLIGYSNSSQFSSVNRFKWNIVDNLIYLSDFSGLKHGALYFFATDNGYLFQEADSDYSNVDTDGDNDQTITAGYTGDGYITLDNTDYCQWNVGTLPKGMYKAVVRAYSLSIGSATYSFRVDNDNDHDGDLEDKSITHTHGSWEYGELFFYTDGSNDIWMSCTRTAGTVGIDHFYCIPLANGIDFPADLAYQSFKKITLKRGLKK